MPILQNNQRQRGGERPANPYGAVQQWFNGGNRSVVPQMWGALPANLTPGSPWYAIAQRLFGGQQQPAPGGQSPWGQGDSLRGWGDPFMQALRGMFGQQMGGWFGGGPNPQPGGGGGPRPVPALQPQWKLPTGTDVSGMQTAVQQRMGLGTAPNAGTEQIGRLLTGREITDPAALAHLGRDYNPTGQAAPWGQTKALQQDIRNRLGVTGNVGGIGAGQLARLLTGREVTHPNRLRRLQFFDNPSEFPQPRPQPQPPPQNWGGWPWSFPFPNFRPPLTRPRRRNDPNDAGGPPENMGDGDGTGGV